jgi:hypothetical protein
MTLAVAATATLGRLRYTAQLRSVSAELALLPGVDRAVVAVASGVEVTAEPGDDASLVLDGGDGPEQVLTGTVACVERLRDCTTVTVVDGGAALARVRPHETYNGLPAMQVVGKLAGLAEVETGVLIGALQIAAYVADPRRTAAEHVAALAARSGAVAAVDAEGRLTVTPWPVGVATVAMRRDREFLTLVTTGLLPGPEQAPVGSGGSGAALAPDAWLVNAEAVTGADDPELGRTWVADAVLRTRADVQIAATAAEARRAAGLRRLRGECWLQPARRPGDVVQVQETEHPEQAGPWLLTTVRHELGWRRADTVLTGVLAGTAGPGSLAGAFGGLL